MGELRPAATCWFCHAWHLKFSRWGSSGQPQLLGASVAAAGLRLASRQGDGVKPCGVSPEDTTPK